MSIISGFNGGNTVNNGITLKGSAAINGTGSATNLGSLGGTFGNTTTGSAVGNFNVSFGQNIEEILDALKEFFKNAGIDPQIYEQVKDKLVDAIKNQNMQDFEKCMYDAISKFLDNNENTGKTTSKMDIENIQKGYNKFVALIKANFNSTGSAGSAGSAGSTGSTGLVPAKQQMDAKIGLVDAVQQYDSVKEKVETLESQIKLTKQLLHEAELNGDTAIADKLKAELARREEMLKSAQAELKEATKNLGDAHQDYYAAFGTNADSDAVREFCDSVNSLFNAEISKLENDEYIDIISGIYENDTVTSDNEISIEKGIESALEDIINSLNDAIGELNIDNYEAYKDVISQYMDSYLDTVYGDLAEQDENLKKELDSLKEAMEKNIEATFEQFSKSPETRGGLAASQERLLSLLIRGDGSTGDVDVTAEKQRLSTEMANFKDAWDKYRKHTGTAFEKTLSDILNNKDNYGVISGKQRKDLYAQLKAAYFTSDSAVAEKMNNEYIKFHPSISDINNYINADSKQEEYEMEALTGLIGSMGRYVPNLEGMRELLESLGLSDSVIDAVLDAYVDAYLQWEKEQGFDRMESARPAWLTDYLELQEKQFNR